jgi:urease beta subunit/alpha-D-ribose 1-methylphosphonate 5-triphosphate synthase subunit PhnH
VSLTGTGVAPVLSVSPASLTYSSQIVGSMSAAQLITVSNTGTSPLTVGTPSFTGTNASDYAISSNGCSAAVNPGSNCTVGVTFAPGAAGSRAATLQIPSDASNGTQAVSLTGTGVAPIASAAPATLTYANQLVNTTSSAQVVTVTNTGTSPLHVGTPTLAGTNPGDFSILSNGCTAVIAVNANCTISVRFRPIAMGSRIGTLQIPSDASNGTQSVSLSGTGIAAVASLAPGSLLYGNQLLNTVSTTQTVTVTNTGTAPLTVSTLTFAGTNPGDFAISSNGCSSAVAAGGNCTIGLTFTPTAVGARSGTLLIASNANNGTRALSLSGTGVAPSASVSPASWAFGNQLLGGTSLATTVTVTNSGTAPLHVGALTLSGANASDFVVSSNGCTSQVAPGANCTISLTFTPSAMGSQVVTLQVSSDASNGAQAVSLTGTGVAPVVSVSPASLTYGSQMVGSMSAAQLITVSNTGTAPLTVGTPTLAGTNPGDFAISSNGCTAAIAANASCTISVTFQPAAMGSRAGTLQIPSDASNGTRSVSLSGTGIAAVASVAPASLSYGNLLLNTTSAAQTVTVTNTGTALLTVSTVTLAGTNPSDFRVSGNGCTAAIAANASCTISVTFKPTAVGGRSGTLQIASNADNGVQSISLSGTGTAPLISVSLTRLAFGDQLLASASPAATVTVTNSGTATLNVGAVSLSGANASDFAVSANGCSSPVAVAANCTISLTFTPGATGSRVGTLLIASDARNGSQTVSLTGNGIAPMAAASPGTLTFANQLVNTPSATQNVVVTNTGTALLHMGTAAISGANAGDFAIISNGCSGSVAVGANCTMSVRFSPSGTGSRAGTLQIVSDATNGTQTISLSGTGIAPAASVAPASLTYSSQLVGSSSAAQTITISNTGTAALHVGTVAVSGSNSGDFAVANNACGSAVAVGQSCTVTLTFSPTAMGSRSATATISSDAINGAQSVSLSGTGIAPLASVTPSSRDFGSVVVLLSSNPMNYTVTNTGTSALNVGTPSFTGANPSEFVISSNGCTSAVAPTGTCSIGVTFKPAHGGSRTAVLQVPSDANNGTQTANATGTGLGL